MHKLCKWKKGSLLLEDGKFYKMKKEKLEKISLKKDKTMKSKTGYVEYS